MAENQLERFRRDAEKMRSPACCVLKADAVKAVAPYTLIQPLKWPRIDICGRWKIGVERGIEYRNLLDGRSEHAIHHPHRFQFKTVVRRSKLRLLRNGGTHVGRERGRFPVRLAAVYDPMPDDVDFRRRFAQRSEQGW